MTEQDKKKKGFLGAVWESMTKTGGCCGPGEDCCGPAQPEKKPDNTEEKKDTGSSSCCGS